MVRINPKSVAVNIFKELDTSNKVHSIFENGINIVSKNGLIFIGSDKGGLLPFAIHIASTDMGKLRSIGQDEVFTYHEKDNILETKNILIDLNKAYRYRSELPTKKESIKEKYLNILLSQIKELNFDTGLDLSVLDILEGNNPIIQDLIQATRSKDGGYVEASLRKVIGRGKGLTPSGDDLLLGFLWLNEIKEFLSREFTTKLKGLIVEEALTTDVSVNYYKSAFKGYYNSSLIDLCQALINEDKIMIDKSILNIMEYGHTSGRDTLAGIALGIEISSKF